jgi:protein SCO1
MRPLPLMFMVAATLAACQKTPDGIDDLGAVSGFTLIDQQGQVFDDSDLAGSVWVVDFFFTRCPTICTRLTEKMNDVVGRWQGQSRLKFLSISVDGEFDSPEVLRAYAKRMQLPLQKWTLTTGPPAAVVELSEQSFKQALTLDRDSGGDILHSSRLLLVDQQGHVRGWFDAFDPLDHPRLDAAIQFLLNQ